MASKINARAWGRSSRTALVVALSSTLALSGVAHAQGVGPGGASDPFEPMNRVFFGVHQFLDHVLLRPLAMTYHRAMPRPVRHVLKNVISNLGEPAIAVNDALQGHGIKAARTLSRFATNTTFGVFGMFDVATPADLPHHDNDFGLTLARYGAKAGPYFFIPLIGPLTLRDGLGKAAGLGLNPLVYVRYTGDDAVGATSVVADGLETRAEADSDLKALYAQATDPYASLRSYYLQNRYSQITGGKLDIQSLPDLGDDVASAPGAPAPTPAPAAAPTQPAPSAPLSDVIALTDTPFSTPPAAPPAAEVEPSPPLPEPALP